MAVETQLELPVSSPGDNALPDYPELTPSLRAQLLPLMDSVSREFHKELLDLLHWFHPGERERFVGLWSDLDRSMWTAFIGFVVGGGDPDCQFLAYLDRDKGCQEAVDPAFKAHVRSLNDFGRALARAADSIEEGPNGLGGGSGEQEGPGALVDVRKM